MRIAAIALLGALLAATAPAIAKPASARHASPISIENAIVTPTHGAVPTNAAYLTIRNAGARSDRLVSAASPAAGMVMLHASESRAGVAHMASMPSGLTVPARGEVRLEPGRFHLMIMQPRRPVVLGARFRLTLVFEHAGPVSVDARVQEPPADAGPSRSAPKA